MFTKHNVIAIYHAVKPGVPCPDGITAAWVVKKACEKFHWNLVSCIGACYDDTIDEAEFLTHCHIVIVDFSFPPEVIDGWLNKGYQVTVIDHHKTAQENFSSPKAQRLLQSSDELTMRFDMEECGASLAWKYFFPEEPVPLFVQYVCDRDLWRHELPDTELVHLSYQKTVRNFDTMDKWYQLGADFLDEVVPFGQEVKAQKDLVIQNALKRVRAATIAGYLNIPYVVTLNNKEEIYVSDICHAMIQANAEAPFVAALLPGNKWSLRSRPDGADVSEVCKQFGGGGHRSASGCTTNDPAFFQP